MRLFSSLRLKKPKPAPLAEEQPIALQTGPTLPKDNKDLQVKNIKAARLLGLNVRPRRGQPSAAVFISGGVGRSVAIHSSDYYLAPYVVEDDSGKKFKIPGLFKAFSHDNDISLSLVSAPAVLKPFEDHIAQVSLEVNNEQRRVLSEILKWAKTVGSGPRRSRYLFIWGPSDAMVGSRGQEKLGLNGRLVTYPEAGSALKATIYRRLPNLYSIEPDPVSGEIHQLAHAAPEKMFFRWKSHYEFDNRCFGHWKAHNLTAVDLRAVLREPFDVTFRLIYDGKTLYVTCCLRAETPIDNLVAFDDIHEMLNDLGETKWERVKGRDLFTIFQLSLPGADSLPDSFNRHPVSANDAYGILEAIADAINVVGDPHGTLMLGMAKGNQAYTIKPRARPGIAIIGPSKVSGKSTLEGAYAVQYGRRFVWVNCEANEYDAARYIIRDFDGYVHKLDLLDAYHILHTDQPSFKLDTASIQKQQSELHVSDKPKAESEAERVFDTLKKHGSVATASILPYGFEYATAAATVRDINYLRWFLYAFGEFWSYWYKRTGEIILFVVDNLSALRRYSDTDPILGTIPYDTAHNLAIAFSHFVSNGANVGIHTHVLTHSEEDLEWVTGGLAKHFGLIERLGLDEHLTAQVIGPGEEIFQPQLGIGLPYPLKFKFERRDEPEHIKLGQGVAS